jgi:hypothetical protein
MKILYLITKLVTYPGAFLKGFWEHCACRVLKLEVRSLQYLPADWNCGHATHGPAATPAKAFLLAFLTYVAQRALGWLFLGASVGPLLIFGLRGSGETSFFWLEAVALFLGLSLLCNSFPSWEDAQRQWRLFFGKPAGEEPEAEESPAEGEGVDEEPPAETEPARQPQYAKLPAKILLAPCNAYFLAGAWLERFGVPAIIAVGLTVTLLIVRG